MYTLGFRMGLCVFIYNVLEMFSLCLRSVYCFVSTSIRVLVHYISLYKGFGIVRNGNNYL